MAMIPIQPIPAGLPSGSFRRGRAPGATGPWRAARLWAAPHRLAFFSGGLVLALAALWWAGVLAARQAGLALPWAVSPSTAHALLMVFGFMPFYFAGFLFTAGPRWLQLPPVPAAALGLPLALMAAGWALALAGFHVAAGLAALGLAMAAAGLGLMGGRFLLLVLQSPVDDRDHAKLVVLSLGAATLSLWLAAAAVALRQDQAARAAAYFGLWAGFALVFAVVAHRMIPFFTASALPALDAWRPRALLGLLSVLIGVQAPFAAAEALNGGALPALPAGLRAAIELPAGALLLWLALRWGLVQSLKIRLLAMLHMGFFWLGVAFTLGGVSHALMSVSGGTLSLGLAPLHALTMGYLGSTLVAMVTRVACGHSGRTLVADDWAWAIFWALQAAVLFRVLAALMPGHDLGFTLLAAQFWLGAMGAWAWRHGRWYGRPRLDGQPG
jgi:uncharacterized protein involved in response to NO